MADLDPLIRYRKHGVDEKRRILAELYRQSEALLQDKQRIEQEIEKETQLAEEMASAEASAYLGRYIAGAKAKIRGIDKGVRKLETKIAVAQEDMRNAFAEMKKVEITQRNRADKEAAEVKRKEEQELDEIAIDGYRRKQEESE